jgi:hypothetical protein
MCHASNRYVRHRRMAPCFIRYTAAGALGSRGRPPRCVDSLGCIIPAACFIPCTCQPVHVLGGEELLYCRPSFAWAASSVLDIGAESGITNLPWTNTPLSTVWTAHIPHNNSGGYDPGSREGWSAGACAAGLLGALLALPLPPIPGTARACARPAAAPGMCTRCRAAWGGQAAGARSLGVGGGTPLQHWALRCGRPSHASWARLLRLAAAAAAVRCLRGPRLAGRARRLGASSWLAIRSCRRSGGAAGCAPRPPTLVRRALQHRCDLLVARFSETGKWQLSFAGQACCPQRTARARGRLPHRSQESMFRCFKVWLSS